MENSPFLDSFIAKIMKTIKLLFISLLFTSCFYAQSNNIRIENFNIDIVDARLEVKDQFDKNVYERTFLNPSGYTADLDDDGISEYLVNDFQEDEGKYYYTVYIYNTVDSFYLSDSIYSGLKEPYYLFSEEISSTVLITGSPDLDSLYIPDMDYIFSPLVCWSYRDNGLEIVNDELYDIYISENEKNISYVDSVYDANGKSCEIARKLKLAIATIYMNYLYANENTNAEQAMRYYYNCEDREKFREALRKLL